MSNQIEMYRPTSDLLASESKESIERTAGKLMRFSQGGGKALTKEQATMLAMYAWMTDLNPFNGECYWDDKMGPMDGVAGRRKKAKEYIRKYDGGGDYHVTFRLAEQHEAFYDPNKGDIAWHCTLTDDKSMGRWQKDYKETFSMLVSKGMDVLTADERAMMIAGPRPEWTGVGVVGGRETFSGFEYENNKPMVDENGEQVRKQEMWDRNERAQKRAEKNALKKRYPDILMPDLVSMHDQNVSSIIKEVSPKVNVLPEGYDPDDDLRALGVDVPASKQVVDAEPLFPPQPEPKKRTVNKVVLTAVVEAGYFENVYSARKVLSGASNPEVAEDIDTAAEFSKLYRAWKDSGKKTNEAIGLANAGEKP